MISIVSPVYRAEKILPLLVSEIDKIMLKIGESYEIILVDDRSPDNSWQVMKQLSMKNKNLKVYRLSRNFGQHATIMAGLSKSKGDWVVVMDCDMQDQPKEIEKLYKKTFEGYDVVMAMRKEREDSFFKKTASYIFSKIFNYLSDIKINHKIANFGIYNKKVIVEVLKVGDYIKSFPLFVYYVGFNRVAIEVEHSKRVEGKSNYNIRKLFQLAFNVIISYSNKPLKMLINCGATVSMLSFLGGISYIILYFRGHVAIVGYASIIVSLFFLSGVIISALGILGIYLAKLFDQTKNRQTFIFDEN